MSRRSTWNKDWRVGRCAKAFLFYATFALASSWCVIVWDARVPNSVWMLDDGGSARLPSLEPWRPAILAALALLAVLVCSARVRVCSVGRCPSGANVWRAREVHEALGDQVVTLYGRRPARGEARPRLAFDRMRNIDLSALPEVRSVYLRLIGGAGFEFRCGHAGAVSVNYD